MEKVYVGMTTPWGQADQADILAPGIGLVATPSHGGILLSKERRAHMPDITKRWYEEDCDIAIPLWVFFDEIKSNPIFPNLTRESLRKSLERWNPEILNNERQNNGNHD